MSDPTGSPSPAVDQPATATAVTALVSGEDAAVWAYGVIGAHLPGPMGRRAQRLLEQHRATRQRWAMQLADQIPAAVAYDVPEPVNDPQQARALAILVERRLVALFADVAQVTAGDVRAAAVAGAAESAARAVQWGGDPTPFGG